jgi:hypothetical protein
MGAARSAINTPQGGKIYHSPGGANAPYMAEHRVRMRARILMQNDCDHGSPALYWGKASGEAWHPSGFDLE